MTAASAITFAIAVMATPLAAQRIDTSRQVGNQSGYDASASPDGTRLVFISVVDRKEQLFQMRVDGSHVRQLTYDAANHEDPAWSPDGRHIAYMSDADSGEVIMVMNADGSGSVAVSPRTMRAIHPSWSRDSRRILFCTDDDLHPPAKNASDIYSVDVATQQLTRMITGGVNTYPSLSPDGRRIAFRRMVDDTNSEVFVADTDGSHARNLTHNVAFEGWPDWSPDGRWLLFASNLGDEHRIMVMRPDGSDATTVATTRGRATAPHWAPDGGHVYFPECGRIGGALGCHVRVADVTVTAASTRAH